MSDPVNRFAVNLSWSCECVGCPEALYEAYDSLGMALHAFEQAMCALSAVSEFSLEARYDGLQLDAIGTNWHLTAHAYDLRVSLFVGRLTPATTNRIGRLLAKRYSTTWRDRWVPAMACGTLR